jgi:Bardet-Biedl syndrome 9 protein
MSLFQAREWWSTKSGINEEYDTGCMCVANVDNEPSGSGQDKTKFNEATMG